MSDPRLHSMHLEGQQRRDSFRTARELIQAACGSQTIAADPRILVEEGRHAVPSTDNAGQTPLGTCAQFTFYLKDGINVYPLHPGMNSIGRLPDNDVVIRDECISRRHCAILIHSDLRCELHDVASKNGTILNGKKIPAPTRLQAGDRITLCNHQLSFHMIETDHSEPVVVNPSSS